MKLRNKKTGNIGDYLCAIQGDDIKLWSATNSYEAYHYKQKENTIKGICQSANSKGRNWRNLRRGEKEMEKINKDTYILEIIAKARE